ncbi:hypothetical protein HPB48_011485 [Haemaphysalis longicornis]|uniref:Uncharacterized protein n=1 Tax=Haemaphysalis longicornis TaxID=44386 RepID=A0A9J6GBB8_HAELO|nr:hypothetical protein HPB48_011485 [Haemaphysalis longicornis]
MHQINQEPGNNYQSGQPWPPIHQHNRMAVELPRPPSKAGSTTAAHRNAKKKPDVIILQKRSPQRQPFPDTECKWARQVEEAYARWLEKD